MSLDVTLTKLCASLTEKYKLYPNRIIFSQSTNKQEEVVSLFVQIFECAYPTNDLNDGTVSPILRINGKKATEMFSTAKALSDNVYSFCEERGIDRKETFDKNGVFQSVKFTFDQIDEFYFEFVEKCVDFAFQNYSSAANKFGCCAKYAECSNAKKCLHANLLYATACEYRKNLEQGKIFYGENRNI